MAFIKFAHKAKNELEKGGRQSAPPTPADENEPSKQCPNCRKQVALSELWARYNTCDCGWHFRMNARQRLKFITDPGSFEELFCELKSGDIIGFPGYEKKLEDTRNASGEKEAVICGTARVNGRHCCIFVMEPYFMMGSMGTAVGEKITRLFEYATETESPVAGYAVSGGARMQEGILSLMQMAKTAGAVKRHSDAGLFFLSILTDPTMGGVMASFATQADVIIAEPYAAAGFAGARVIEQTTRKKLPPGFQMAEFLLKHGFVDAIVPRSRQRSLIASLLELHTKGGTDE